MSAPGAAGPDADREATSRLPRLLVVDDQALQVRTLYEIFHADHEVFMATSGAQALQVCEQVRPDLVLLDVDMPDLDGTEVCRQLKSNPATRDIPVIFVTALDRAADETRGLQVGAVDFITKPVNPDVVRARVGTHLTLKAQADQLRALAFRDGLTGVFNRRHFDEKLGEEWRACQRTSAPLSLILTDVDHFKKYNDRYGHQVGDECLKAVARVLADNVGRSHDVVARYGGEEFVFLLPNTSIAGVRRLADAVRAEVEALGIPHEASSCASVVTISAGCATTVPTSEGEAKSLIAQADQALYRAKQAGRNRVECPAQG